MCRCVQAVSALFTDYGSSGFRLLPYPYSCHSTLKGWLCWLLSALVMDPIALASFVFNYLTLTLPARQPGDHHCMNRLKRLEAWNFSLGCTCLQDFQNHASGKNAAS